jgi:hypothetical protein
MLQRATLIGAVALLALAMVSATYDDTSGTAEKESQRNQCGNIVKPHPKPTPDSSPAPPSSVAPSSDAPSSSPAPSGNCTECTYSCDLIDALYEFSLTLTVTEQVVFEAFLEELQIKLSVNVSSMSLDDILVFISFELKAFLEVNIEIKEKISFLEVTDSTCGCKFGYLQDVISVAIMIQAEKVDAVVELDADEDCPLFKSMRDSCQSSEEEEWEAELELKLKVVLKQSGYSKEQKLTFCFEIIAQFIVDNPDCEGWLMSIDISAFGSFSSFLSVCKVQDQTVNVKEVISGSSASDCELIKCLDDAVNNASNGISYGCKSTIYQISGSLKLNFQSNGDNQARLKFCSTNIFQMIKQAPWCAKDFYQLQIGVWGTIYDLEFCSNFCSEFDSCDCVNEGPGTPGPDNTTPAVTASDAPSSAAPSSNAPSSNAPSSSAPSSSAPSSSAPSSSAPSSSAPSSSSAAPTTPAQGNCGTRTQLVTIGVGASGSCTGNCSALTDAVQAALDALPSYQKGSFSGIVASIKTIVFGAGTAASKVSQCVTKLNSTPSTVKASVMATIVFVLNVSWGSLQQFCTCG